MKILAVRGSNLASLAGSFEIDFAGGPLGHVGLFAITGPTGSGKSTLLDAMCLALYNKTPRLGNRGGVAIGAEGEAGLMSKDPRSLLRRGAVAAYAEVDFEGVDGRTYRARWSTYRARQKVDGAVQGETLDLVDLATGQSLAGTKGETLEATARKVGLTFEQFRQSVLLAQGDFAAFLEADSSDRAALLERMTGTEIYGELSRAAYKRAADAEAAVQAQRQALGGFQPLSPEERSVRETELAASQVQVAAQDRAVSAALVMHAISFVPITLVGLAFMVRDGLSLGRVRELAREPVSGEGTP